MVKREKLRVIGAKRKREAEERAKHESRNAYAGCVTLPHGIPLLSARKITPEQFFQSHIATRTPAKFTDHLTDADWKVCATRWHHDYLRDYCPESMTLKVEYRNDIKNEHFGKGQECFISFHEFLRRIEQGDDSLYLTTQELEYDTEGQPYILTDPLSHLTHDFPLTPSLFQSLIISNINLWYGQTKTQTTSGLHHDFHDNLYVMLKGEKEITLISPAYALELYTEGKIVKIHPNGRINYEGQLTEADGRDLQSEKALEAAQRLQEAALRLEAANDGEDGDEAEDEIDRALEAILDAEMDNFDEDDEDDFDDCEDDDEDDEEDDEEDEDFQNLADFVQSDLEDDEEEEEEESDSAASEEDHNDNHKKKRKRSDGESDSDKHQKGVALGQTVKDKGRPKSFSRIDTSKDEKEILSKFPEFVKAKNDMIKVTIKAGEMLYIPAGWFHEVKSKGATGHIAFNYWFHPPDQANFNQPYSSDFWKKNFESRKIHKPISKPTIEKSSIVNTKHEKTKHKKAKAKAKASK